MNRAARKRAKKAPQGPRETRTFVGHAYLDALRKNYPQLVAARNAFGFVGDWMAAENLAAEDHPTRFVHLRDCTTHIDLNVWRQVNALKHPRWVAASMTYKGLIHLKPPFDLVLYSNLLWELKPRTIIEFGALQGGSALWFADQQELLCGRGQVHSFELLTKAIHRRAKHSRLKFHAVDLRDLHALEREWPRRLPHPWLVVDDAHTNLESLIPFVAERMAPGDYFVLEDMFMSSRYQDVAALTTTIEACRLRVDRKYTDAFGDNVTCSPNSWFRKF